MEKDTMNRVQRTRKKGAKLPPYTLCINRGTRFGNRFKMNTEDDREKVISLFRDWVTHKNQAALRRDFLSTCWYEGIENLACFCPPDKPCHADVWIEIWNKAKRAAPE